LEQQSAPPKVTGWQREVVLFLDRQIYRLAKHWLAVFNVLTCIYVFLPILAPVLMVSGAPAIGRLIYLVYRPACHQLPERSFFLFGPELDYTLDELWARDLISPADDIYTRQRFLGAIQIGYKIALCQRDLALYGSLFVGGLIFVVVRKRLRPLSLLAYLVCLVPMAIDGGTQLIGLRESLPVLRLLTGSLLGFASVWLLYPRLDEAFDEVRWQANQRVQME
jgi:uncharacterized membrane protein